MRALYQHWKHILTKLFIDKVLSLNFLMLSLNMILYLNRDLIYLFYLYLNRNFNQFCLDRCSFGWLFFVKTLAFDVLVIWKCIPMSNLSFLHSDCSTAAANLTSHLRLGFFHEEFLVVTPFLWNWNPCSSQIMLTWGVEMRLFCGYSRRIISFFPASLAQRLLSLGQVWSSGCI